MFRRDQVTLSQQGMCACLTLTWLRCHCGEWYCEKCQPRHASAPGGRCPTAVRIEARKERVT